MASCNSSSEALPDPDAVFYFEQDLSKRKMSSDVDSSFSCCGDALSSDGNQATNYILGTLIIRIVAARGLQPVVKGGLARFLLGSKGNGRTSASRGSANPYVFLSLSMGPTFANQSQRTSTVINSIDPTWSRGDDLYYFDVTLPVPELVAEEDVAAAKDSKTEKGKSFESAKLPQHFATSKHHDKRSSSRLLSPVVTLQMFHEHRDSLAQSGDENKYPSKVSGNVISKDSRDIFLGESRVNIIDVLTGRLDCLDEWLPLFDENKDEEYNGEVRVVIEYEPTDSAPRPGDMCRLTSFCQPKDVYPIPAHHVFLVDNVEDNDNVILSYTSPEGWLCTFCVHRYMVVCAVRHQAALEIYQDQIVSLVNKIAESPMKGVLSDVVNRVPNDGLMDVGIDAALGTQHLLSRWFNEGVETAVKDLIYATNLDGHSSIASGDTNTMMISHDNEIRAGQISPDFSAIEASKETSSDSYDDDKEALPNMPCCPITGEKMREPVVAADGHSYERRAIARWLQQSNKSPLTGEILRHKELVTNYSLIDRCSAENDGKPPAKKVIKEKRCAHIGKYSPSPEFHDNNSEDSTCAGDFGINYVSSSDDLSVDLDNGDLDLNLSAGGLEVSDDE